MGKKRIVTIDEEKPEKKKTVKPEKVHVAGLKGGQRLAVVTEEAQPEKTPAETEEQEASAGPDATPKKAKTSRKTRVRGKKYRAAKIKIDPTKSYSLKEAIALVKETTYAKFDGTLEVHLVTSKTGLRGEVALPHFQGKTKKVKIANEAVLKEIESGKIDFDILLSTPAIMPQLLKYAKILGPRGLMPNPKAGTITDDPEKALAKFQKETFSYKTEANAPLIHAALGKISQKNEELEANLEALLTAIGPKNLKKAVIKSTMGPAVKLNLN